MSDQTRELADQAAEAIRSLNHLTQPGSEGLEYPSDVYDIIGSLGDLAGRLPQLLGQLGTFMATEMDAGRIRHDSGDLVAALGMLGFAMTEAQEAAGELTNHLRTAHNATGGLASRA